MQRRALFDFEIEFANGGSLKGEDFRLDIEGEDVADDELADYLVRDMRLLMVESVRILKKAVINEPHKRAPTTASPPVILDVSHVLEDGFVSYKGRPSRDLSELPLTSLAALDGVVIRVPPGLRAVSRTLLSDHDLEGRAVLIQTGWDIRWGTEAYFDGHPFLTEQAAHYLVRCEAALVGIDSLNIDDAANARRPVHTTLLAAGIPVVEHLTGLDRLPATGFRFFAVPVKVRSCGTCPARAFAVLVR